MAAAAAYNWSGGCLHPTKQRFFSANIRLFKNTTERVCLPPESAFFFGRLAGIHSPTRVSRRRCRYVCGSTEANIRPLLREHLCYENAGLRFHVPLLIQQTGVLKTTCKHTNRISATLELKLILQKYPPS